MKERTRKHHGYQPGTSPTHQNFASYSTSDIPISWAHKTVSRSHDSCWISMHQTYCRFFFSFFLFLKVFFFFSFFLPLLIILKMFLSLYFSYYLLYFSSLCFLHYCSLFPLFLYYSSYITPPILLLLYYT